MARDLSSPDIQIRRDKQGHVREMSHPHETLSTDPAAGDESAIVAMADAYVREHARDFGMEGVDTSLRAGAVKHAAGNSVSVTFDQYAGDWPVWRAGVTVRIDRARMRVTGAHNAAHLDIRLHRCGPDAPYAEPYVDAQVVRRLLGLPGDMAIRVRRCRTMVYGFTLENRLAPHCGTEDSHPDHNASPQAVLARQLPPLPQHVREYEGMHCVVTEVLFSVVMKGWGEIHCRAFIEPESGAVLYLRALVSGATGVVPSAIVFTPDPGSFPTPAGEAPASADSPVAQLDPFRKRVELPGLDGPDAQGKQALSGELVRLANLNIPALPMPSQSHPFAFDYACDSADFAACSAYYHCDGVFRLIESLGIDVRRYFGHTAFPITVDPHAFDQEVNAQALGNSNGRGIAQFMFGSASAGTQFGIATDVRVVLHEFGHALLWEHIGSPTFPFAHSPGDSLAAILSAPLSSAKDPGRTYPFLSNLGGFDRRHDREVSRGWGWHGNFWNRDYGGEQVLSTTLFRVYEAAGGRSPNQAERVAASRYVVYVLLTGIAMLDISPEHPEVLVDALIEADAMAEPMNAFARGCLGKVIRWAFEQQGLYRPPDSQGISLVPGEPPEVDVYIDDGRRGGYEYEQHLLRPPGLWNRASADGGVGHEQPAIGMPNFAYVRVGNRGKSAAANVEVAAFQMPDTGQRGWGRDWIALPAGPLQVAGTIPRGGSQVVGPFEWTPGTAHDHLLVHASAPGDRSSLLVADPVGHPVDCYVLLDNNIVERRF